MSANPPLPAGWLLTGDQQLHVAWLACRLIDHLLQHFANSLLQATLPACAETSVHSSTCSQTTFDVLTVFCYMWNQPALQFSHVTV